MSRAATCGVYWLETESPMTRQLGSDAEISRPGPGDQHSLEPGYLQPFAAQNRQAQHEALAGQAEGPCFWVWPECVSH